MQSTQNLCSCMLCMHGYAFGIFFVLISCMSQMASEKRVSDLRSCQRSGNVIQQCADT